MFQRKDHTSPAFAALFNAINLKRLKVLRLREEPGHYGEGMDKGRLERLAANIFAAGHVWIRQMASYRTDSKDWSDVLEMAKDGLIPSHDRDFHLVNDIEGPLDDTIDWQHSSNTPYTKEDLCQEMTKLLSK